MLNISIRHSRGALLQKATKIKILSIILRVLQVLVSFCCCVGLSYSLVHPGWWTNFGVSCGCTYTVAVISAILDLQQLILYLQARTGSTIFKNSVPTEDISAFVKSQYGLFLLCQMAVLLGWLTVGTVLISTPHGKDFRESFNDPPVAAWDLAIASAFIEVIFSFFACFLVHRERQLLEIHLKRNREQSDGLYTLHLSDYPRGPPGSAHTRRISSPIGPPVSGVRVEPSPPVSSAGPFPASTIRSGPSDRSLRHVGPLRPNRGVEVYDFGKHSGGTIPTHMHPPPRCAPGLFPAYANVGVPLPVSDAIVYDGNWI